MIYIRSQVKTRLSQSYKFEKKYAKNLNFKIWQENLHATHLLKMLEKMYEYQMDPTRTVGATEQTWDAGRTDGHTDGRTDRRTEWNQYTTPLQLRCVGGKSIVCVKEMLLQFSSLWSLPSWSSERQVTDPHLHVLIHHLAFWNNIIITSNITSCLIVDGLLIQENITEIIVCHVITIFIQGGMSQSCIFPCSWQKPTDQKLTANEWDQDSVKAASLPNVCWKNLLTDS